MPKRDIHPRCGRGRGHKTDRYLEICLLVILYEEIGYGYRMMEQLSDFGFTDEEINITTLYRRLRRMEQDNLIISSWEDGSAGPKRRVYEITDEGKQELDYWIENLKERKARIEHLIFAYEQQLQGDTG